MSRFTALLVIVCLFTLILWSRATVAGSDSLQYDRLIQRLASSDCRVDVVAGELSDAEAIGLLEQAVKERQDIVSHRAAEILLILSDSDQEHMSSRATIALDHLAQMSDRKFSGPVEEWLAKRHATVIDELRSLGAAVESCGENVLVGIGKEWQGGNQFRLLRTLRAPIDLVFAEKPPFIQGFMSLQGLNNLNSLTISASYIDQWLVALAALPNLKSLRLTSSREIRKDVLIHVAQLPQIEELDLFLSEVPEDQLRHLVRMPNLKHLRTPQGLFSDDGMVHVGKISGLEVLSICNSTVSHTGLAEIHTLGRLRNLTVRNIPIGDEAMVPLQSQRQLQTLSLQEVAISDKSIETLKQLPSLSELHLRDTYVSRDGVEEAKQARPDLQIDGRFHSPPTREHVDAVKEIRQLGGQVHLYRLQRPEYDESQLETHVTLGSTWGGGLAGLRLLAKLDRIDDLRIEIELPQNGTGELAQLTQVRDITLIDTGLGDDDLVFLKHLPHLGRVSLAGKFTDAAIPHLSETVVKQLDVSFSTKISREGLWQLHRARHPDSVPATGRLKPTCGQSFRCFADFAKARLSIEMALTDIPSGVHSKMRRAGHRNLTQMRAAIIPLLVEEAKYGDRSRRFRTLRLLAYLQSPSYTSKWIGHFYAPSRVARYVKDALAGLREWDKKNMWLKRSDQEVALMHLASCGLEFLHHSTQNLEGYRVVIGETWKGGDEALKYLAQLQGVRAISVNQLTPITSEKGQRRWLPSKDGLRVLASLPDLESLSLRDPRLDPGCLQYLRDSRKLKQLTIHCPLDKESLAHVRNIQSLQSLHVWGIPDEALRDLAKLPDLEKLEIARSLDFIGEGLGHFSDHPRLQSLTLNSTGLRGEATIHVSRIPNLYELSLSRTPVGEVGMRHICNAKQLKKLTITRASIVDTDLKNLKQLRNLEQLNLSYNGLSEAALPCLPGIKGLLAKGLHGTFISDDAITEHNPWSMLEGRDPWGAVSSLSRSAPSEEYMLTVRDITRMGACVTPLKNGSRVDIFQHWSGGARGFLLLKSLEDVQEIWAYMVPSTGEVEQLKQFSRLKTLYLLGKNISDEAVAKIRSGLPNVNVAKSSW